MISCCTATSWFVTYAIFHRPHNERKTERNVHCIVKAQMESFVKGEREGTGNHAPCTGRQLEAEVVAVIVGELNFVVK